MAVAEGPLNLLYEEILEVLKEHEKRKKTVCPFKRLEEATDALLNDPLVKAYIDRKTTTVKGVF